MNKRVVRRLLETFFRRWYLYLVPLVLFTLVGAWRASDHASGYRSVGVIDVARGTLLSELTSIRGENYGYDTPANYTARTINSLIGTDRFVESIAERSGLAEGIERGAFPLVAIRRSIAAAPNGDSLLKVMATTFSPDLSARLVSATISSFIDYVVEGDVSESKAAATFFEDQLAIHQGALAESEAALATYAATHPGGPLEDRPLQEQLELQRLQSGVEEARAKVTGAQQKADEARLATEQAEQDVRQRLRIVDEPDVAVTREPWLRDAVMTLALFVLVGAIVSIAAVVLATVADRSLMSADDAAHVLKLPVLAVVPRASSKRRTKIAEQSGFTSVAVSSVSERGESVHSGEGAAMASTGRRSPSRPPAKPSRSRRPSPAQSEASS
jgi:uncharacterized protein involved in exopolysaccharide biosynthesis